MKATIAKGAIGVLGASGLGVGGYFGYQVLNNKTEIQKTINPEPLSVSSQLVKESYTPITNSTNDSHIQSILNNYTNALTPQDSKFANFDGNDAGTRKAGEILLEKCNNILNNTAASETDKKKAKKWCVEPITASALLGKRKVGSLNTNDATNDAEWKNKIKEYRSSSAPKIQTLSFTSTTEDPTEEEIRKIKEQCKTIGEKKNHEDKFEETLGLFEAWCSSK